MYKVLGKQEIVLWTSRKIDTAWTKVCMNKPGLIGLTSHSFQLRKIDLMVTWTCSLSDHLKLVLNRDEDIITT